MTYPLSSDVSAGQPTAVDHYNNLRADSLRFGQAAADAVNLGALLSRFVDNINLVYLATNRVRVEATPGAPVSIVVNGVPLRVIANVDLPTGSAPSGAAAAYYVFAIRSAGATTFTLDVNTSPTEWTDARLIGSFYWDGSAIVQNTISTEYRDYLSTLLNFNPPQAAQGRLTLTPALPVTVTDVTAGTLYFEPYGGNTIYLYSSTFGWVPYSFDELSLSFAGAASAYNYDILAYFDGTNVVMEKLAWSNDTTRATALALQNGRYCKTGELHKLYLGTVRTISTGNIADTLLNRYVWNNYNRVRRILQLNDPTANWTYSTGAWQQMRATAGNKIQFVIGLSEDIVTAYHQLWANWYQIARIGIGLDAVNALAAGCVPAMANPAGSHYFSAATFYKGYPGIGHHYLAPIEYGSATPPTFYGGEDQLMQAEINA